MFLLTIYLEITVIDLHIDEPRSGWEAGEFSVFKKIRLIRHEDDRSVVPFRGITVYWNNALLILITSDIRQSYLFL